MPSAAVLRYNALTGIKRFASAEPMLPFLYNTQTIRRQHTDALSDFEDSLEYKPQTPRRTQGNGARRTASRIRGKKEGGAEYQRQGRGFQSGHKEHTDGEGVDSLYIASETSQDQYRRPPREDHVPFEHADQETTSIRERIAGSTMTPSEKKAFQELLSLPQQTGKEKTELDKLLNRAVKQQRRKRESQDAKPMPPVLKKMQDQLKEDGNAAQRILLDQAVAMDLKQVKEAFDAAQTDVELWKVLHKKVLSRVISLNLDQPIQHSSKQQQQQQKKRKPKAPEVEPPIAGTKIPEQSHWPGSTPDQLVITRTLPLHLVEAQRLFMYDFPATHLGLSLLPYLKSLGPSTFALAASTRLYNQHMRALREAGNFPAIIQILEEMDKEVYDFDDKTHDIVGWIPKRAAPARKGVYGVGVEALWNGERFRKALGAAGRWNGVIAERMQEKALREARARDEEEGKTAGDSALLSM